MLLNIKKIILVFIFCASIIQLFAQNDKKNLIGTHGAFGFSGYGAVGASGASSYSSKNYYSIGFDYSRQLSKRLDLSSGLEYTRNELKKTPPPMGVKQPTWSANLTLVTVPVQLKYRFGKGVFLNGGLLFNIFASEHGKAYIVSG